VRPRIPPPIVTLLAGAAMWALDRWLPLGRWFEPPWHGLGALPALAGAALIIAASGRFRAVRTTINPLEPAKASQLVTDGVFRWSRNPMYLGLLLLLGGWALWLGSASPWLVLPMFTVFMTVVQIAAEEQALARVFGAAYLAYRKSVPRWLGPRA
jgi:protein-S-isoprenylcysteine O-methyltransferase Ste14